MPQGLSLSVSLFLALAAFTALGSPAHFLPFLPLAVCALGFLMSRGDELRQLRGPAFSVGRARGLHRSGPSPGS